MLLILETKLGDDHLWVSNIFLMERFFVWEGDKGDIIRENN